jgi:hypothetical protein
MATVKPEMMNWKAEMRPTAEKQQLDNSKSVRVGAPAISADLDLDMAVLNHALPITRVPIHRTRVIIAKKCPAAERAPHWKNRNRNSSSLQWSSAPKSKTLIALTQFLLLASKRTTKITSTTG